MDVESIAVDSPLPWAKQHIDQYLASDGEAVEHPNSDSLILLYTKGRRTGWIRRIPIVALRRDGEYYVMASKGGAPAHPEWYLNLAADPSVWVRDGANLVEATASTLSGADHAAMYERFVARFPNFRDYQSKTERVIPIVRLTPAG